MMKTKTFDEIVSLVKAERVRQDEKWGTQRHPYGTSLEYLPLANDAREICDYQMKSGKVTWADILNEEYYEALSETDSVKFFEEAVQNAAVWFCVMEQLLEEKENANNL